MTGTVTISLEEFDRLRQTIGKQDEEMALFTKAVETVFQIKKLEVFERFYSIQDAQSRNAIHRAIQTGQL